MTSSSPHLPLVLALALVLGATAAWTPPDVAADPLRPDPDVVAEARDEVERGRHWHAAELLRPLQGNGSLGPEGRLVMAEAQAGFRNWSGVLETLEGAGWLDAMAPVRGPYLLARAHEALGHADRAAEAYARVAERQGRPSFEVQARLARTGYAAAGVGAAIPVLEDVEAISSVLAGALAWELTREATAAADSAAVGAFLARVRDPEMLRRSRDAYPRSVLAAGDSVRGLELFRALLEDASDAGERAIHGERVAMLLLARGDTAAARDLFLRSFRAAPGSGAGMRAARYVVELVELDAELALEAARALDRLGDGRRALRAYDLYVARAEAAGIEVGVGARVERARLASTLPGRVEEAVEEFRALDEHPDPAVGARVLGIWTDLRRSQGQTGNVRTLRQWLVERYPDTDQAAEVVFLRGDVQQDLGDLEGAIREYREVARMAPSRSLAGLARMRTGQIQLQQGKLREAAGTFQDYLDQFPDGRRWTEASFWAGRTLLELDDRMAAEPHFRRVLEEDPFSYYGAQSARALGVPYPPVPAAVRRVDEAAWVQEGLAVLDLLEEAELAEAAALQVRELGLRAGGEGPPALYPLGEGLIARGWTIEGINQGWALRREGEEWNSRLLGIIYPYPHREMVEREAAEWGVDPFLMAALIRQESAWDRDIVSSAGAVGLMQVMPATGRQLARAIGPEGFTTESLESAEVNLHLGGRFLRDMLQRFGPELPLVLSAYNAGPTRANRWKSFPEHADPLRFTERIPFTETRGYVKNVTRNADLYRALYGDGGSLMAPVEEGFRDGPQR